MVQQYRNLTTQTLSGTGKTVNSGLIQTQTRKKKTKNRSPPEKPKYIPLFDPFSKKPVIEAPKDLQEVFYKIMKGGFYSQCHKKCLTAFSNDGLTQEAMEVFGEPKDKGALPGVVVHTAVVEAYCQASKPKEAVRTFMRI